LKPAPTPLPVIMGVTAFDGGGGVESVLGTVTARRVETSLRPDAAIFPRESRLVTEGGGGMSVRGSTPGEAPMLQPANGIADRMRTEIGISLRIICRIPCCASSYLKRRRQKSSLTVWSANKKSPVFPPGFLFGRIGS
jgi:hypothetical protein